MTDREQADEYVPEAAHNGEGAGEPVEAPEAPEPAAEREPLAAEAAVGALAEAFAERVARAAGNLLNAPFHARVVCVTPQTDAQFLAGVGAPTCCYALRPPPARTDGPPERLPQSTGWVELDREFAFVCIDRLLGGAVDQAYLPDRPLTAIERKLLRRVLAVSVEGLHAAWPRQTGGADCLSAGRFELAEGWGCRPLAKAAQGQPAVTVRLEVAVSGHVGMMRLCLPATALDGLEMPRRAPAVRNAGPMELSVALPDIVACADEVRGLAPGDIITTDTPVDGEAVVRVAGIPKFAARLGASGGKRAVTLTRRIGAADGVPE